MHSNLQKLLEGSVLNEETKAALQEAWESKITEAREEIAVELREEFALRYEKDKNTVFEAMDAMVKDQLKEEFEELRQDKLAVKEAKVKLNKKLDELSEHSEKVMKTLLDEELKEFRSERKQVAESLKIAQDFVQKQLKEELEDFNKDRNALIEARVNFEKTKSAKINEAKKLFVENASKLSERVLRESLKAEMKQLKDDLNESKQNMFGKKLFEAFAQEFMSTQYNEKAELKKLSKIIESSNAKINKLMEAMEHKDTMLNEAKKEAKREKELRERNETFSTLLSPLNKSQRNVMQKLLESTPTHKLNESFNKYINVVLKEDNNSVDAGKTILSESSQKIEYDGNHKSQLTESEDGTEFKSYLKALSGIK